MLAIAFQTLRSRRGTLSGAFVAIFLAVALTYATGSLLAAALSAPGPGRFAAADLVLRADPTVTLDEEAVAMVPAPALPADAVAQAASVAGVRRAVADVSFDVFTRGRTVDAHGWASPAPLRAGQAPRRSRDVVAGAALGVR